MKCGLKNDDLSPINLINLRVAPLRNAGIKKDESCNERNFGGKK
jgi:hypothetical protein